MRYAARRVSSAFIIHPSAFIISMPSPIPGIAPPELSEVTSMVVWPSIGSLPLGRLVGRLANSQLGVGPFRLGRLAAGVTIPLTLVAFAWQFIPLFARRYRLTNRRVIIVRGLLAPHDGESVGLDEFDAIRVEAQPGQDWLHCGELVFLREGTEVLRLSGVSRPAVFREVCLKARLALVSVRQVLEAQAAAPCHA
jgi:hypothetical protein